MTRQAGGSAQLQYRQEQDENSQTIVPLLCIITTFFSGCSTRTQITSSWVNEKQLPDIGTVLIIALSESATTRRLWENTFAEKLGEQKIQAVPSYTVSAEPITPEKEAVLQVIKRVKADTVIITHLIDSTTTLQWHPGTIYYEPAALYGGMYRYYNTAYRTVYSPPTTTEQTVVRLETNMYDIATTELLWAAQSSTLNPKRLKTDFESIVKTLIGDMEKNGIPR